MEHAHPLAKVRHTQNLTQQELGRMLGLPRDQISKAENGRRPLRLVEFAALVDGFRLTDGEAMALLREFAAAPNTEGL